MADDAGDEPTGDIARPGASSGVAQRPRTSRPVRPSDRPDDRSLSAEQLRHLVDQYGQLIYRLAVAIVHDHSLAEDIVQDVVVKAWRSLPQGDASDAVRWLRVVTRNTSIDTLRRRRFDETIDRLPEAQATGAGPEHIVEERQHLDAVWDALGGLDLESRTMLAMREADELSYDEIADTMGLTVSAVKAKLYRARHLLRRNLTAWESDAPE